jgi:ribonuclease Z
MHPLFLPRLINRPFGDPGLFIPFQFERRALIFDLGDLSPLSARDLLKISHAFVTHTHMDHFVGFDTLLRSVLGRARELALFGPAGFIRNVEGKLAAYTWDLVDPATCPLRLHVTEVDPAGLRRRSFTCGERFAGRDDPTTPFAGTLLAEPAFRVDAAVLAHSTDCLGLALTERFHINILVPGLEAAGLASGPWLNRFKAALYAGADAGSEFEIEADGGKSGRVFRLGELAQMIARITPGRKIVYITDVGDSPENRDAIEGLAADADLLFIEAAFLDVDRARAAARHHLTARQAGEIAARVRARRFTLFHHSPRYEGREAEFEAEARAACPGADV